jgi:hypothetical protein
MGGLGAGAFDLARGEREREREGQRGALLVYILLLF